MGRGVPPADGSSPERKAGVSPAHQTTHSDPKMNRVNSSPPRFAALDLGSLTVRLAVAERTADGDYRVLVHAAEISGLGQGLARPATWPRKAGRGPWRPYGFFARCWPITRWCITGGGHPRVAGCRQWPGLSGTSPGRAGADRGGPPPPRRRLASPSGGCSPPSPPIIWLARSWSSTWAAAAPNLPCAAGTIAPIRQPAPGVLTLSQARPLGDPPQPGQVAALQAELAETLRRFRDETFPGNLPPAPACGHRRAVTTLAACIYS